MERKCELCGRPIRSGFYISRVRLSPRAAELADRVCLECLPAVVPDLKAEDFVWLNVGQAEVFSEATAPIQCAVLRLVRALEDGPETNVITAEGSSPLGEYMEIRWTLRLERRSILDERCEGGDDSE